MALTERSTIDKIEVLENGIIQVRQANIVERDGVEIAKTYHRWTLAPGQDLTGQEQRVVNVANAVWTEEIVSAYQTLINSQAPVEEQLNTTAPTE
jgi:hypothetical protein